jgi:8-oxo-dGTP diphosphatase
LDQHKFLVATDVVLFGQTDQLCVAVLLIERKNPPFQGCWAFPGGFLEIDEDLAQGAVRELKEETGVDVSPVQLVQIGAYGHPDRDPRGRVISVAFTAAVNMKSCKPQAADDAASLRWFNLNELPELAFDHAIILRDAINKKSPAV